MSALDLLLSLSQGLPPAWGETLWLDGLRFLAGFLLACCPVPGRLPRP